MKHIQQLVSLADLRFYAYHGYYPEEQVLGNEFTMTIQVKFIRREGNEDNLNNTINYETLYHIAKAEMQRPRKLLEAVAAAVLTRIYECFPVIDEAEVSISKSHPPFGGDRAKAAVALSWKR